MSTISSMAHDTYTLYKMAAGNTPSTSGSSSSAKAAKTDASNASDTSPALATAAANVSSLSNLVNAFSSSHTTAKKTTAAQDSLTNLWSSYTASASSSGSLASLSSISGISTSAAELVSSYDEAKKVFSTQFGSAMSDLTDSAKTVAKMNYNFSPSDITTAENGTKTYSDSLKSAIKNVKQLVSDYNDALNLTSDYSSVSKRMKSLASTFADTTYRADSYKQIGINVDSATGELSVDEDKLASALVENGSRVQNALGNSGLAGKAESHASFALSQQDKAFPSMQKMLGNQLTLASAYTNPKLLTASVQYGMIGNLLNMSL
jgi:hypothetical protein